MISVSLDRMRKEAERSRAHSARRVDAPLTERATRRVSPSSAIAYMPAFADLFGSKRKAPHDDGIELGAAKRQAGEGSWDSYWMVQWYVPLRVQRRRLYAARRRNKQTKKHKTWDGDAVLLVRGGYAELLDMEDRRCARPLPPHPCISTESTQDVLRHTQGASL